MSRLEPQLLPPLHLLLLPLLVLLVLPLLVLLVLPLPVLLVLPLLVLRVVWCCWCCLFMHAAWLLREREGRERPPTSLRDS